MELTPIYGSVVALDVSDTKVHWHSRRREKPFGQSCNRSLQFYGAGRVCLPHRHPSR